MKPLRQLWPAIESVPGLKAVKAEWDYRLSTEMDVVRPYLVVTRELATSYPALETGEPHPIVPHGPDDFAAINPAGGEPLALRRTDVLVHRFDGTRFAGAVGAALAASGSVMEVSGARLAWRIGTLPLVLGARPAYVVFPWDSPALVAMINAIAEQSREPYLLLAPTRRWIDALVEARLKATDGQFIPICDVLHLDADGRLMVPCSVSQSLVAMFGPRPSNVFQCQGENWTIAFDGKTTSLKRSVGLIYITMLLREPNKDIPVAMLYSAQAGIDPRAVAGSSGELLTKETRNNYEERYRDLCDEIDDAKNNHDLGRSVKLENEKEQLDKELKRAIGLGGRSRRKEDVERLRNSVSEAIRRDIKRIAKAHALLGRHLKQFIECGRTCRYVPEREMNWLT